MSVADRSTIMLFLLTKCLLSEKESLLQYLEPLRFLLINIGRLDFNPNEFFYILTLNTYNQNFIQIIFRLLYKLEQI